MVTIYNVPEIGPSVLPIEYPFELWYVNWCVGTSRLHTTPINAHFPLEMTIFVPAVVVDGVPCACNSCECARAGVMIAHPAGYVIRSGLETYVGPPCACQSCCRSREDVVAGRL